MNARIVCVGRLKEPFYEQACAEYLKRLSRYGRYEVAQVSDESEPAHLSQAAEEQMRRMEGERILKQLRREEYVIVLAIEGKRRSSPALAAHLEQVSAQRRIAFVIGGSLGVSDAVLARADETLSFSDLTFPHQLARVILLEQLYRCEKIRTGERYHK